MALPWISWLLLSLIVTCEEQARVAGSQLQCYTAPSLTKATDDSTAFREILLPLLGALPSAAAPTGFASLRSDRAFVRGLCFVDAMVPSDSECLVCLSAAATNITAGCSASSRRAGIWTSGCFLAYADTKTSSTSEDASRELLLSGTGDNADTDTSSPREDASRELLLLPGSGDNADTDTSSPREDASRDILLLWGSRLGDDADTAFYYADLHYMLVAIVQAVAQRAAQEISGPQMLATMNATTVIWLAAGDNYSYSVQIKVWVVAQCARGVAAVDCVRCLQDSARAVDWDLQAARGILGEAVGVKCYLRFEVSISAMSPNDDFAILLVAILFVVLVLNEVYPSGAEVPIIAVIFLMLLAVQKDYS